MDYLKAHDFGLSEDFAIPGKPGLCVMPIVWQFENHFDVYHL